MEDLHTSPPSDRQREAQTNPVQIWEVGDGHGTPAAGRLSLALTDAPPLLLPQPWPNRGRRPREESRISLRRHLQMGEPSPTVMRVTS